MKRIKSKRHWINAGSKRYFRFRSLLDLMFERGVNGYNGLERARYLGLLESNTISSADHTERRFCDQPPRVHIYIDLNAAVAMALAANTPKAKQILGELSSTSDMKVFSDFITKTIIENEVSSKG